MQNCLLGGLGNKHVYMKNLYFKLDMYKSLPLGPG